MKLIHKQGTTSPQDCFNAWWILVFDPLLTSSYNSFQGEEIEIDFFEMQHWLVAFTIPAMTDEHSSAQVTLCRM